MMTEVVGTVGRKLKVVCDPSKLLFPRGFLWLVDIPLGTGHWDANMSILWCENVFRCHTHSTFCLTIGIGHSPLDHPIEMESFIYIFTQVSLFHFPHHFWCRARHLLLQKIGRAGTRKALGSLDISLVFPQESDDFGAVSTWMKLKLIFSSSLLSYSISSSPSIQTFSTEFPRLIKGQENYHRMFGQC